MAPVTVNNHRAHLSALFSWITAHAPASLLRHGDPTKKVAPLPLAAPTAACHPARSTPSSPRSAACTTPRTPTSTADSAPCARTTSATPSPSRSPRPPATTALNSNADSATPMTATCACTPTCPTTSLPAISRISDPASSRGGAHHGCWHGGAVAAGVLARVVAGTGAPVTAGIARPARPAAGGGRRRAAAGRLRRAHAVGSHAGDRAGGVPPGSGRAGGGAAQAPPRSPKRGRVTWPRCRPKMPWSCRAGSTDRCRRSTPGSAGRFRQRLRPGPTGPATLAHQVQQPRVGLGDKGVDKVERQICLRLASSRSISSRRWLSILWVASVKADASASSI